MKYEELLAIDTVWTYFKEKVEQYNIIKEPESHVKTH